MRRIALPLLALVPVVAAVVTAGRCAPVPVPLGDDVTTAAPAEEHVERRRVDTAGRTALRADDDEATAGSPPAPAAPDAPTAPLVLLGTRDASLDLPRRHVAGVVVDAEGAPVAGAHVALTSRWLPPHVARRAAVPPSFASGPTDFVPARRVPQMTSATTTGGDGRFSLPYVGSDHLWIDVGPSRYRAPVERPHEEQRIVLREGQAELDVHVTRASDGAAVEGAIVLLEGDDDFPTALALTDADGFANVGVSVSGRRRLSVFAEGLGSVLDRAVDITPREPLDVRIALPREARLRGRVLDDATGRPVAGAHVGPGVPRHWSRPPALRSDADGRFELHGMAYEERVSRPVGASADGYVPVATWLPSRPPPDGVHEIELRLVRGGSVRVRCVDAGGAPVPDALVYAEGDVEGPRPADGPTLLDIGEGAVWTGSDGVAVVADLPHDDDPLEVRVYLRGVEVVRRTCAAPSAGERVDLGDVLVVSGGRLAGTVRTAEGSPAAGVRVVVVPDDPADEHLFALADAALGPDDERHGVTDAAGRFAIPGLAAGTWHGLAWTQGGPHAPALARGIVVPPRGDPAPVDIRLPRAAVLRGVLRDADSRPLAGARVGALRDGPVFLNLLEHTRTDEQGRFRLPGVTAVGLRVWIEVDLPGDCVGRLVTASDAPIELRIDGLESFDPDVHDRAMGR